ncbi:MAG TPA: hypothetical protein VL096_09505, partial [Pirellulaceae bacterium]|nr:hypothetical protein [Pirellulaceae bacterium]
DGTEAMLRVAIERQPDPRELQLAIPKPREIWWEATLPDGTHLPATTTDREYQTPLPQWQLRLSGLSSDNSPTNEQTVKVSAWWLAASETPAAATFIAGRDFHALSDLVGKQVEIAGDTILIETLHVQQRRLPVGNQYEDVPCLIGSIRGGQSHTYWLRWREVQIPGREHRHYPSIGRHVGYFWPIDENALIQPGTRLEIVALETLKRRAETYQTHVSFDSVAIPASKSGM